MEERRRDALEASREGNKRAALLHLRRMKDYQASRDNRLTSLYTLEKALHQVWCSPTIVTGRCCSHGTVERLRSRLKLDCLAE